MISFFNYFFLWIISGHLSVGDMCSSCFCNENIAECYLKDCNSAIVQSPFVEIIRIHGHLCDNHIQQLSGIFFHNTIIELLDMTCAGLNFNCRDNAKSRSAVLFTTASVPFIPVKPDRNDDYADYYDDPDEDDFPDEDDDPDDSVTVFPSEAISAETTEEITESETSQIPAKVTSKILEAVTFSRLYPILPDYRDEDWWKESATSSDIAAEKVVSDVTTAASPLLVNGSDFKNEEGFTQ